MVPIRAQHKFVSNINRHLWFWLHQSLQLLKVSTWKAIFLGSTTVMWRLRSDSAWRLKTSKESKIYRRSSCLQLSVSKNRGTPKSSILVGFSITNHPFWGTFIFGNTQLEIGDIPLHDLRWKSQGCKGSYRFLLVLVSLEAFEVTTPGASADLDAKLGDWLKMVCTIHMVHNIYIYIQ